MKIKAAIARAAGQSLQVVTLELANAKAAARAAEIRANGPYQCTHSGRFASDAPGWIHSPGGY